MMSGQHDMDNGKLSSTTTDSARQMRGWFKLIETIRNTDPPSSEPITTVSSRNDETIVFQTNGHASYSPPAMRSDSPPPESPPTTPIVDEPIPKPTDTKRSTPRRKKITIRKSTRSKEFSSTPTAIPDDDILPNRKRPSLEPTVHMPAIPFATDLQSLPGLDQDELRDQRFLDYADLDTLSVHLRSSLHIDKRFFSSSSLTRQHIFKTRHNTLSKIFHLDYLKSSRKFALEKKDESESSSTTLSASFKTDWSVNRRSTPTHRHEPKNLFHILQLNPKQRLSISAKKVLIDKPSDDELQEQHYEHIKGLLVRTYHPHFHTAVQRGHYFGSKSKIFRQQSTTPIIMDSPSPPDMDESMAIKLHSPVSNTEEDSRRSARRCKHRKKHREQPATIGSLKRRVSEEIPAIVLPASPELVEREVNNNTIHHRKRNASISLYSDGTDRKKKKIVAPLSPELISNESQNQSYSDSDSDALPNELPKPNFIRNGLRSNYYKTPLEIDSEAVGSKLRPPRRSRQLSSALPPFYTGLFQSDEHQRSYVDYRLPYDIYWFSQQTGNIQPLPSKPVQQRGKKKVGESKQKQPLPNKRIARNVSLDPFPQQDLQGASRRSLRKDSIKIEELSEGEKQIVSQSHLFLQRNLRRIKQHREFKDKNNNQHKQQAEEPALPLFFAQNYYHPRSSNQTHESSGRFSSSHKDLLNLSYNLLRRSHFAKVGRFGLELVDTTCYYAQLAQLTLLLNEMFDLLLNYKCLNSDVHPSNALKKCPSKRLFPMYYEIISKPMDLSIMRQKLDNGDYLTYHMFEEDFLLLCTNAITYCGDDSDVARAVKELQRYYTDILKPYYEFTINLFADMQPRDENLQSLEDFVTRFHAKEVLDGQIREAVYSIIFDIDQAPPVVYKTVAPTTASTHRATKNAIVYECTVNCRCGSTNDETMLVQCYACQLWQHASCTTITDATRPYFCFECHPLCADEPSRCLKTNVCLAEVNQPSSYATITRADGLTVRVNECYLVSKEGERHHILCVERLWFDKSDIARAAGFYYLRPDETLHETSRKFFPNEVFRFPPSTDSIELTAIVRPCYVLDPTTFCKGKPMCEYGSRIPPTDLFVCEYRVDKLARTFTRLPKSKHVGINTKSYCFDNYIEKLTIRRDYQSHGKEYDLQPHSSRRRSITHPSKLTGKQFEEKSSHIDGTVEKIYCRFHHADLIPTETKLAADQFFRPPAIDESSSTGRGGKRLRNKNLTSTSVAAKKPRTQFVSSSGNLSETATDAVVVSSLLNELIQSILSHAS